MKKISHEDQHLLSAVFARMDVMAMAIAMGVLFAVLFFLVTVIPLLLPGSVEVTVHSHLVSLRDYLPGYSISATGAVFGSGYGLIFGITVGVLFSILWNLVHYFMLVIMIFKTARLDL